MFYAVRSQSDSNVVYVVDLDGPACQCEAFRRCGVRHCKHVAAARRVYSQDIDINYSLQGPSAQAIVTPDTPILDRIASNIGSPP
jgi:hypothetical protein